MKKLLSILLALALLFTLIPAAFAASEEATAAADTLHALGLFNGTGDNPDGTPNYALDRALKRSEAVTMLVRLLGKEEEAKAGTWDTPFSDVSGWPVPYVGYAYANKLTSGTGPDTFSGENYVTATQYLTFVLRALGYDSSTDFAWNAAWELSDELGITHGEYSAANNTDFDRGDVVQISAAALGANMKGAPFTLAEKLIGEGVFTAEQYEAATGAAAPADDLVLTNYGLTLTIPAEYVDLVIAETPEEGSLFTVYEKASVEASDALGEEEYGAGWLFSIDQIDETRLHELLCGDTSGLTPIACDDDDNYYLFCSPTDVRFVRESYEDIDEDIAQWTALNGWAGTVCSTFAENNGLTPVSFGNTPLDIYLYRVLYQDLPTIPETPYTVSTLEFGPLEPGETDPVPFVEKLLSGVIEWTDEEEAPDGEYAVLNFPEDGERFDFFFAEGGENLIRRTVTADGEELFTELYRITFEDDTLASAVMSDWYDALAADLK